jgi:nucleoid DNA-binding protein
MQQKAIVEQRAQALGGPTVQALRQGEPILLRRCGTWQVRATRARVGRNRKTGAAAAIPARRVVRCVATQTLKRVVAEGTRPAD